MSQNNSKSLSQEDEECEKPLLAPYQLKFQMHHEPNTEVEQINYYNEYCRLFLANSVLQTQLRQLNTEKSDLMNKLNKLEKKSQQINNQGSSCYNEKKKRMRRSAGEIARHYKCQLQVCSKSYGSEGSLNQHIKLKHPQLFQKMINIVGKQPFIKQFSNSEQLSH